MCPAHTHSFIYKKEMQMQHIKKRENKKKKTHWTVKFENQIRKAVAIPLMAVLIAGGT